MPNSSAEQNQNHGAYPYPVTGLLLFLTAGDRTGWFEAIHGRAASSSQTFTGNAGTRAQNIRVQPVKHQATSRLPRIFGGLTISHRERQNRRA
jgi:hypothetical protein